MKIFLSSTFIDLVDIRQAAISYLNGLVGHISDSTGQVVAMELFGASERTCKEECLHELAPCDLVIGIYGNRYGTPDENGVSMTEVEYDYAITHNIDILAFVLRSDNKEAKQAVFIKNKVHGRNKSCGNFTNAEDFLDCLDKSLKDYLKTFDGYSIDSLWGGVSALIKSIEESIANDDPGSDLQMMPYASEQEAVAISTIIDCAKAIQSFTPSLSRENSAVIEFASYQNRRLLPYLFATRPLRKWLKDNPHEDKFNWEIINLGMHNCAKKILLAAMFLKLKHIQKRLLTEKWTETLRLEALSAREEYEQIILSSKYSD